MIAYHVEYNNDSFAVPVDHQISLTDTYYLNLTKNFRTLDDDIITYPIVFYTHAKSFISEMFDKLILDLHQHGFLVHLKSKYVDRTNYNSHEENEPKVLTIEKLSAGFLVWIGCVAVASIVFIAELILFNLVY